MSEEFRRRRSCALCRARGETLLPVLSLAPTPPANEFVTPADLDKPQGSIPLTVVLCPACGHAQLAEIVDAGRLFREYVYVSGTSPLFVAHFSEYAETVISRFGLGPDTFVLEVGSNDGTLLKQFQARGLRRVLGIDPAQDIAREAETAGVPTLREFFSLALAEELRRTRGPVDVLCANNVFAHAEDLVDFGRGVRTLLADQGVFVFEVSYLMDVVEQLLFDTIYHEHVSYHALTPLVRFFESLDLRLFDCQRIPTHGGSLRGYVCRRAARHRDPPRMAELCAREREMGLFGPEVYASFKRRITARGERLGARLAEIRKAGQRVAGFGAPAKLTTLMHEFGAHCAGVEFIVDDSAWKQGRYTPGTHIPVLPASALYQRKPDWCIVFAWNFADAIVARHREFTAGGGHFLVPLPALQEIP
jgi:SAM-dependent methyltransferase